MKVVIQRCKHSSVSINNKLYNEIDNGLCILVGFTDTDNEEIIDYMVKKIINLRIFDDENGIMNKNILETDGSILSISQFTLYADTTKGNRPSYYKAMKSENATKLYNIFNERLKDKVNTKTGVFGEEMLVNIENDGPVTIIIEKSDNNDN